MEEGKTPLNTANIENLENEVKDVKTLLLDLHSVLSALDTPTFEQTLDPKCSEKLNQLYHMLSFNSIDNLIN